MNATLSVTPHTTAEIMRMILGQDYAPILMWQSRGIQPRAHNPGMCIISSLIRPGALAHHFAYES